MFHYLFSFQGRINRAKLWLFVLINLLTVIVIAAVVFGGISASGMNFMGPHGANDGTVNVPILVGTCLIALLLYIVLLWASLALTVKRLHDRNKGAIWLLAVLVLPLALEITGWVMMGGAMMMHPMNEAAVAPSPLATVFFGVATLVWLWWFIELYCLRGTIGENRFGPDPLAN